MRAANAALTLTGYDVDFIDLYSEGWNPVLDATAFTSTDGPFKPQAAQEAAWKNGTRPADVAGHLGRLLRADLLILSFPVWWFSMPAIFKGWVDKVFVNGATFGGELGLFENVAMHGENAIVLTTTGGSPHSFSAGGQFGDILFPSTAGSFNSSDITSCNPSSPTAPPTR